MTTEDDAHSPPLSRVRRALVRAIRIIQVDSRGGGFLSETIVFTEWLNVGKCPPSITKKTIGLYAKRFLSKAGQLKLLAAEESQLNAELTALFNELQGRTGRTQVLEKLRKIAEHDMRLKQAKRIPIDWLI
jgi:hypothetical protein